MARGKAWYYPDIEWRNYGIKYDFSPWSVAGEDIAIPQGFQSCLQDKSLSKRIAHYARDVNISCPWDTIFLLRNILDMLACICYTRQKKIHSIEGIRNENSLQSYNVSRVPKRGTSVFVYGTGEG